MVYYVWLTLNDGQRLFIKSVSAKDENEAISKAKRSLPVFMRLNPERYKGTFIAFKGGIVH